MKTVLVVDNDPETLHYTASTLNRGGISTIESSSGEEALRIYGTRNPEVRLLLTNVTLAQNTGIELAAAVSAQSPKLPVVFMTEYKKDHLEQFGPALEGHEILEKPFTPEELLLCVRRALHPIISSRKAAATSISARNRRGTK